MFLRCNNPVPHASPTFTGKKLGRGRENSQSAQGDCHVCGQIVLTLGPLPQVAQEGDPVEYSLVVAKPDGVKDFPYLLLLCHLAGLERVAMDMFTPKRDLIEAHYAEHADKPWFGDLVASMMAGPVIAMVVKGHGAISVARAIMGATDPEAAHVGTFRYGWGETKVKNRNGGHTSDSAASAKREIALWFPNFKFQVPA